MLLMWREEAIRAEHATRHLAALALTLGLLLAVVPVYAEPLAMAVWPVGRPTAWFR